MSKTRTSGYKPRTVSPTQPNMKNASRRYLDSYPPDVGKGDIPTRYEQAPLDAENKSNVVRSLRAMGKAPTQTSNTQVRKNRLNKVGPTKQFGRSK